MLQPSIQMFDLQTNGWDSLKDFNQSLTSVTFPSSLESLHLGKCFDQSINGAVIPNLETLTFGWSDSDAVVGCRFWYFCEIDYSYLWWRAWIVNTIEHRQYHICTFIDTRVKWRSQASIIAWMVWSYRISAVWPLDPISIRVWTGYLGLRSRLVFEIHVLDNHVPSTFVCFKSTRWIFRSCGAWPSESISTRACSRWCYLRFWSTWLLDTVLMRHCKGWICQRVSGRWRLEACSIEA